MERLWITCLRKSMLQWLILPTEFQIDPIQRVDQVVSSFIWGEFGSLRRGVFFGAWLSSYVLSVQSPKSLPDQQRISSFSCCSDRISPSSVPVHSVEPMLWRFEESNLWSQFAYFIFSLHLIGYEKNQVPLCTSCWYCVKVLFETIVLCTRTLVRISCNCELLILAFRVVRECNIRSSVFFRFALSEISAILCSLRFCFCLFSLFIVLLHSAFVASIKVDAAYYVNGYLLDWVSRGLFDAATAAFCKSSYAHLSYLSNFETH